MNNQVDNNIEYFIQSLNRYVNHGLMPGSFLTAVLSNDLMGAISHSDLNAQQNLVAICKYIYNNLPGDCWGSRERVREYHDRIMSANRNAAK